MSAAGPSPDGAELLRQHKQEPHRRQHGHSLSRLTGTGGFSSLQLVVAPRPPSGKAWSVGRHKSGAMLWGQTHPRSPGGSCSAFLSCTFTQQTVCLAAGELGFICTSSIEVLLAKEEGIWWQEMDGDLTAAACAHHRCPTRGCAPATGSARERKPSPRHSS